jgi:peptidoglycan/LPS O-acetylase OafA/YrhL
MKKAGEWFFEFDYVRAFAILAVISAHVSWVATTLPAPDLLALVNIAIFEFNAFCIPSFIFISAFLLYHRHPVVDRLSGFWVHRLRSIVPPYLVASTVYIMYSAVTDSSPVPLTPQRVAMAYLTGSAANHLWFILLIIELYALYPWLSRWYSRLSARGYGLAAVAVAILVQELFMATMNSIGMHYYGDRIFLSFLGFFLLGFLLHDYYDRLKEWIARAPWLPIYGAIAFFCTVATTIVGIAFYASNAFPAGGWFVFEFAILGESLLLLLVCLRFGISFGVPDTRWKLTLQRVGDYSFGLYLFHYLPLEFLGVIVLPVSGLNPTSWIFYPVLFAISFGLAWVFVAGVSRLRIGSWIIGPTRR